MKTNMRAISATAILAALGFSAAADIPTPPPTPSSSIGIEVDLKPNAGARGEFLVSSVVTDLESGAVIARPRLVVGANKPARIETGNGDKWNLQINVVADGTSRMASYDASFMREGKLVSKQRVSVKLDS